MRTVVTITVAAALGVVALKFVAGLIGAVMSLLGTVLWVIVVAYVFYLILKLVSPRGAQRVREVMERDTPETES